MQSVSEWTQVNFGACDLGDKRRTNRLMMVAEQFANNPSASLPNQLDRWADLKAAYRLFDCEQVTFEAIARPHWMQTRKQAQQNGGRILVIGDTTELDFGKYRNIQGVGPTGNGSGQGFLLHNAMMVNADSHEILGIAGQTIHHRKKKQRSTKPLSTARRRRQKDRESLVWGKVIDDIGTPADHTQYVHVFDRGADNFEVYCHLLQQRSDWVIRASQMARYVLAGEEGNLERMRLKTFIGQLKPFGRYTLSLRTRGKQVGRDAELEVRVGKAQIPRPLHVSPWVRELNQPPIPMWVVEVVEVNAPKGVTPIRWVLFTSLPIETFKDAWQVIGYYELRWLIEEYHKALKTGCRAESHQLKTGNRLEALIGLASVVAVRLLKLKSSARTSPEVPAQRVVPAVWLRMLKLASKGLNRVHDMTVGQFYRAVAKLGGFLARTGDGEPGWITIWRGWEKLNMYVTVASKLKLQT